MKVKLYFIGIAVTFLFSSCQNHLMSSNSEQNTAKKLDLGPCIYTLHNATQSPIHIQAFIQDGSNNGDCIVTGDSLIFDLQIDGKTDPINVAKSLLCYRRIGDDSQYQEFHSTYCGGVGDTLTIDIN